MKPLNVALLAFGLVCGSVGTVKADPTFIESHLTLRVEAAVVPSPLQWQTADRWLTGGYADKDASVTIASSTSNGTAVAFSSASESWDSTAQGRVTFDQVGFVQAILRESGMANVDNSYWYYTFSTEDETTFAMDYATGIVDSTLELVGIQGFSVAVFENGELIYWQDVDLEDAGSIAVPLDPYQTFTVMVIPNGGFSDAVGLGISSMWGDFSWSIE